MFKDNAKDTDKTYDLCLTDSPYNIDKDYGSLVNDSLSPEEYKAFSIKWFKEAKRIARVVFILGWNHWEPILV